MFGRIGRFVAGHARAVLVVTVLVMIGAGALGFTAFGKLKTEGFADPNAESSQAQDLIDGHFGGRTNLVFLITADSGTVDDPAIKQAGTELSNRLAADSRLTEVTSYFSTNTAPMKSTDGRYAIAVAHVQDHENELVKDLRTAYGGDNGTIKITLGGAAAANTDISSQIGSDLALAEGIAVPLILILLVFAFGSLIAALLPLAIALIAVLGTFAELSIFGSITDVSIYAVNLTTALGLGLAIDYALLMVSRFREELSLGSSVDDAVERTVRTAGRTIVFSAATVAAALAVMLLFPLYFLRSFAYAGIGVIAIAALGAIIVLPALLKVLGKRINAGRLPWTRSRTPSSVSAFWGRLAATAMKRPVLTAVPVLALLIIAAIPLLRVEFGVPDDRVVSSTKDVRAVGDVLRDNFDGDDSRAIQIVTTGALSESAINDYSQRLSALPGVVRVSATPGRDAERFTVVPRAESVSNEAQDLVGTIRSQPGPTGAEVKVGGPAAVVLDGKDTIGSRLPLALALIAITTFALLFLFTGSVLQPLRALLFNVIGLGSTLGMMVLIFQQGWLSDALGFTPLPLNINMLVLLFTIAFGLSMDYEVFVISRIKEMHDYGASPTDAVSYGLSRTGRIVSTAAVLLAVSFFAFGTSGVSFLQLFGLGAGLAVLVDATLIRGILLPVGMRILGSRAWWAPGPLRRIHDRVGITESPSVPEPERVPV